MLKVELPNRKEVAVSNYYWNLKKQKNDINQNIKATQEEIKKCKEMLKRQLEDGIDVKYKKKLDALLKEQAVNFQRLNEFNENVITDTPSKKQLMRAENRKRNLYSEEEKPDDFLVSIADKLKNTIIQKSNTALRKEEFYARLREQTKNRAEEVAKRRLERALARKALQEKKWLEKEEAKRIKAEERQHKLERQRELREREKNIKKEELKRKRELEQIARSEEKKKLNALKAEERARKKAEKDAELLEKAIRKKEADSLKAQRLEERKKQLEINNFQHYTSYVNPIQIRFDNKLKNNIAKLTKNFEVSKEKIVKQYAKMITDEEEKNIENKNKSLLKIEHIQKSKAMCEKRLDIIHKSQYKEKYIEQLGKYIFDKINDLDNELIDIKNSISEKPTLFEEFRKRTSIELEERITVLEQELKQEIYTVTKELEQEKEEAIRQAIFNKVEHCKQILEVFYKQVFEVLSKRQKLYEELLSITYKKLHFSINNNEVPTNIIESEKIVNEECLKLTNEIKFVSNKITRYENIILYSSKIYNDQNIVDVYEQMTNNRNTIKENLIIEIKERFKDRVWKKISGTTNYEVSDHGEIISYSTNYPILKTPYVYEKRKSDTQLGSLAVGLMKYNDKTNLYVKQCLLLKRIVAQEFLPNEFQEFCRITHKDGNPLNCSVTNLIIKKPES